MPGRSSWRLALCFSGRNSGPSIAGAPDNRLQADNCHRHLNQRVHPPEEFYSVPSRLIGHRLWVRLYDDRLEWFLGANCS